MVCFRVVSSLTRPYIVKVSPEFIERVKSSLNHGGLSKSCDCMEYRALDVIMYLEQQLRLSESTIAALRAEVEELQTNLSQSDYWDEW